MRYLPLIGALLLAGEARAATIPAASCARDHVQAAITAASDGDTVQIPACGVTGWASAIYLNKAIAIVGAGIGVTNLRSDIPADGGAHIESMLVWTTKNTGGPNPGYTRLAHLSLSDNGSLGQGNANSALLSFSGNTSKLVVEHLAMQATRQNGFEFYDYVRGVISHVSWVTGKFGTFVSVKPNSWGNQTGSAPGYFGAGDGSWSAPLSLGTQEALVFENIRAESTTGFFNFSLDGWRGMRIVWRYSQQINASIGNHGTETPGRERGAMQWEYYRNTSTFTFAEMSPFTTRGGTGIVFDNTATTTGGGHHHAVFNMSTDRGAYPPPHPAGQYYPWYLCGIRTVTAITRSGTTATATTADDHYLGTSSEPGHVEVRGASDPLYNGEFQVLTVPSARSFTYQMSGTPGGNASGSMTIRSPYDGNTDATGYPCLDQVGRGAQTTIFDGRPDVPNGLPLIKQELAPVYVFNNQLNGALSHGLPVTGAEVIRKNRDYYDQEPSFTGASGIGRGPRASRPGSCTTGVGYWATDEGEWDSTNGTAPDGRLYTCTAANIWTLYYTPLAYPHPLVSGVPPTNPIPAPAGVQNVRVVTVR